MKKKKPVKKGIVIAAVSAAAVIVIIVASVVGSRAGNTKANISYIPLQKTSLQDSINVTGTIRSNGSSDIYSTLNQPVEKVSVSVGDTVKEGDILAVLDTSSLSEDISQQESATKAADSSATLGFEKARSDYQAALDAYNNETAPELAAAKNSLSTAQSALSAEQQAYAAVQAASGGGKATQQDVDAELAKLKQAQQAYASAQQAVLTAKAQTQQNLKEAKSAYDAAVAKSSDKSGDIALEKLKKQMQQSVITAPRDGTVTQCSASVGDIPKTAMFRVEDPSDLIVDAEVKEIDVGKVKTGDKVSVTTDATGKTKFSGEVVRVAPAATESPSVAGQAAAGQSSEPTFTVRVHIDGQNPNLRIGMKAKLNIVLEQKNDVFVVPYDSLVQKSDGSYVIYTAKPDGALYRVAEVPVTVGMETDVSTEITGSGLQQGMKVITGTDGVSSGQIVVLSTGSSSSGED